MGRNIPGELGGWTSAPNRFAWQPPMRTFFLLRVFQAQLGVFLKT